jgi:hypothetical protein
MIVMMKTMIIVVIAVVEKVIILNKNKYYIRIYKLIELIIF